MHGTLLNLPSNPSNDTSRRSTDLPVGARRGAIALRVELCAHHFEAPDGPEGLKGPKGSADNVDDAGEGVAAEGLDAADEAGMAPIVGEGQRRRDGGPDTEDDVHAEKDKEDGVCERAVLDCRMVHTHVPAQNRACVKYGTILFRTMCLVWKKPSPEQSMNASTFLHGYN